jgi:hypothetical protein
MRAALLCIAVLFGPVLSPAAPALACPAPSIPVYPGARLPDGARVTGLPVNAGNMYLTTDAPLLDIQRFYFMRLPGEGWQSIAQLPGQYIQQFGGDGDVPIEAPEGVMEFTRNDGHESVRIVGQAGGYSIYVDCRD